ncbi:4-alpha-glucanotransferase [Planctomycetaceae bacterium SCGC AG-212-F19]|nr:4-alpha-glucanotransferase [Planctomycetaceae bacterium SCGC AG-212-F19]
MTTSSKPTRSAGVLLHPTSLPSPFGIGDLGPAAFTWVDALARARQKWWQILPLGPTGFGDSPYQSFSAFAGNPYLLSPEFLLREGLVQQADLKTVFPVDRVDYGPVIQFKVGLLNRAWETFKKKAPPTLRGPLDEFCARNAGWLDDYALFMSIKGAHGGASWHDWPGEFRLRKTDALAQAKRELADAIGRCRFGQFLFFRQWRDVKKHANEKGIRLIGDVPIFVSSDSADVWANPDLFMLDGQRRPTHVAGVPPDYFSATGQLWGNPLYNWEALRKTGYTWWIARLKAALEQVDLVRIDHFRGFESYWEVPAGMPTAEQGRWVKAPGVDLFEHVKKALGGLPLLAEDLGIITPEVEALRDRFNLPGMRILQFAFGGDASNPYLPHNYWNHNTVAYTGTHDNDTTRGWFATAPDHEKDHVRRYLSRDGSDIAWDFIRLAWSSSADTAIAPLQDVLMLPTSARMNMPGRATGNWGWRFTPEMLSEGALRGLAETTVLYGRA